MNFLAHSYLSGQFDDILVGNLMGDFVKGKLGRELSGDFLKGLDLHRKIDSFTDTHPIVKLSKSRLFPTYRHYGGVITDLYFDHFLASKWEQYANLPLKDFARQVYHLLDSRQLLLPKPMQVVVFYMQSQNWLVSYASVEGMDRAFKGLARRTKFKSGMEYAVRDLRKDYALYQEEFEGYFPQLVQYVGVLKGSPSASFLSWKAKGL
jgi:acyl carrier protein phosphodiesterase